MFLHFDISLEVQSWYQIWEALLSCLTKFLQNITSYLSVFPITYMHRLYQNWFSVVLHSSPYMTLVARAIIQSVRRKGRTLGNAIWHLQKVRMQMQWGTLPTRPLAVCHHSSWMTSGAIFQNLLYKKAKVSQTQQLSETTFAHKPNALIGMFICISK